MVLKKNKTDLNGDFFLRRKGQLSKLSLFFVNLKNNITDNCKYQGTESGNFIDCEGENFSGSQRHEKGGNERYTIFSHLSLRTLEEYYKKNKPQTYVFEGRNNKPLTTHMVEIAVRNAASKAGIKKK